MSEVGSAPLDKWSNVIVTDPEVNSTTFAITNTGSAYNAAADLSASSIFGEVGFDYNRNPRPGAGASGTAYDIGAVEYQDDSATITMPAMSYSLRRKIMV